MSDEIVRKLYLLTLKAIKKDEVPIACIITKNNKIISKAYNQKIRKKDPTAHAEILAIKKACKKLKTWNLNDCKLYVTLKPCKMCESVMKEARIKKIYYIVENNKVVNNNMIITKNKNQTIESKFSNIISTFFKNKR